MPAKRIIYLDGMRGLAILGVCFFHAYSHWEEIQPFNQSEIFKIFFSYGFLGVNLFFSISGFVIYASLRNSDNILMFGVARYIRLAPAMFIASIFLYFSSLFIPERPIGIANIQDFLPSLTFIDPKFLTKILSINVKSLDGAFWSLYIEVQFYFVSSVIFFLLKDKELRGLLSMFILYLAIEMLTKIGLDNIYVLSIEKILSNLGAKYYGWFLIGIYCYKYKHSPLTSNLYSLFLICLITVFLDFHKSGGKMSILIASAVVALLFIFPLFNKKLKLFLSSNIFLFFGFISYPLYLIHQNLVTGLAIKLYNSGIELPNFFYPLPFLILAVLLSFFIAKLEPLIKTYFFKKVPIKIFYVKLKRD